MTATREIWILGANGRCGRAVAVELAARQHPLVLVGRDAARLRDAANRIGGSTRSVVADSIGDVAGRIARSEAAVVVNTIGPFTQTAVQVARECPRGCHYVDIANELYAVVDLLGLRDEAAEAGKCVVTGAGFGLLATDSIVLKLCEGAPPAASVRVDALPFVGDGGPIGDTFAATIVEALPVGGRRYENGALVRAKLGEHPEHLAVPDGSTMVTAAMPTGDLEAARRASGASSAVAASSMAPSAPIARFAISAIAPLFASRTGRDIARRRLARVNVPSAAQTNATLGHTRASNGPTGAFARGGCEPATRWHSRPP